VSDQQMNAIKTYLQKGGTAWLALPFGTHDEKGFLRKQPLSAELIKRKYKNLQVADSVLTATPLQQMIDAKKFKPIIKQVKGDAGWAVRIRLYNDQPVIHFINTKLNAVPHPTIKDISGIPVATTIGSAIKDNELLYEIDIAKVNFSSLSLISPELDGQKREAVLSKTSASSAMLKVNFNGINIYAVAQP
jgi:hypothetical protein